MKDLHHLLTKLNNSLNKNTSLKERVAAIIKEETGGSVQNLFIKDGVVQVVSSSSLKSEINLKEEKIKERVKKEKNFQIKNFIYK